MRKTFLMFLVMALFGSFMVPAAQAKIVLRLAHTLDPTSHYHQGALQFKKLVEERSKGEITVDIYHSSQLGGERDAIEGVTMGTIEMALPSTGPLPNFNKAFMVFDLPFIVTDRFKAYAWLDGPEGRKMLDSLQKQDIVGLAIFENGFRNITNSVRAIKNPEDLKGLKIRLMENQVHMASFKELGAYPTPMPMGEVFTALQQGTVDGQENPLVNIYTSKIHEVQKHVSLTGHVYSPAVLMINKGVWDAFTPEQRELVQQAANDARDFERQFCIDGETKFLKLIKEHLTVTEVDKAAWAKALAPVYKQFEDQIGKEIIESLVNAQK